MDAPPTYNKFQVNLKVKPEMKISELARQTGVAASTIRFYEEHGVLEPAVRRPNGYRDYGERALRQLHIVRVCQSLGFTLDTIRGFFKGDGVCDRGLVLTQVAMRVDAVKAQQAALDAQLQQLATLQEMLENDTGTYANCTLSANASDHEAAIESAHAS